MQYDRKIAIAVGRKRTEIKWKNQEIKWSDFVKKLSETTRTMETYKEYLKLPKSEQDDIKDVGGFVGGYLKGGRRKADTIEYRTLITLDADSVPEEVDLWDSYEMLYDNAAVLYSTHKHQDSKPRLRFVIPLNRKVSPEEYEAIARQIAATLGMDYFDDTTYQPHRLMYFPSTSSDGDYLFKEQEGPWLDADRILATYDDWADISSWPTSSRVHDEHHRLAKKQGDPEEKPGLIGAFCRVYNIHEAIDKYLNDVYTATNDENRYTFTRGSTAGGLVVYDDKFAYSHHSTDPCGGKLCNSFDLVRIHLYGDQDEDAKPNTPVNKLPSFVTMSDMAMDLPDVKENLVKSKLEEAREAFGDDYEIDSENEGTDWMRDLESKKNGLPETTILNIDLIIQNDPLIKDVITYNEFEGQLVLQKDAPWRPISQDGKYWRDNDEIGFMKFLYQWYKIKGKQTIIDAIKGIQNYSRIHPIKDYLSNLNWDGVNRVDTMLIDYLGADDNEYTRAVTRKMLVAAIKRIYSPGAEFEQMLVMSGPQGIGKSTILRKLGKEWFNDNLSSFEVSKENIEQIIGSWILEVSELSALKKSEVEKAKQFLSVRKDKHRLAYDRNSSHLPRQCVFFGTTNDATFLQDKTGNRRFWVVPVGKNKITKNLWKEFDVDQVWAEAVEMYKKGESLRLSEKLEEEAKRLQDEHYEESPKVGMIEDYLERLLPENWDDMSVEERRRFIQDDDFGETAKGTVKRDKVCALEIWVELFNNNKGYFPKWEAKEINSIIRSLPGWEEANIRFGKSYGKQRGFIKREI